LFRNRYWQFEFTSLRHSVFTYKDSPQGSPIAAIKNGGNVELADGTSAKIVLRLATNHLPALAPGEFGHMCVLTARPDGSEPALTIRVGSIKPDTMLAAIEEDLNDALGQFSGARPCAN
jgi:hypothetical protein